MEKDNGYHNTNEIDGESGRVYWLGWGELGIKVADTQDGGQEVGGNIEIVSRFYGHTIEVDSNHHFQVNND